MPSIAELAEAVVVLRSWLNSLNPPLFVAQTEEDYGILAVDILDSWLQREAALLHAVPMTDDKSTTSPSPNLSSLSLSFCSVASPMSHFYVSRSRT